ncbi:MAG: hypothetical protein ABJC61_00430 [Acidobacteriota bacterium]
MEQSCRVLHATVSADLVGGARKYPCASFLLLILFGISSATGQTFTEFSIPSSGVPHPPRITVGPDGNLWFTVQTELSLPFIGRLTPAGAVTAFGLPTHPSGPALITAGPDGNLWFTESFDNPANRIGRITTSGDITEFPIPTRNSEAVGIAAGPDGALWFTERSRNKIDASPHRV